MKRRLELGLDGKEPEPSVNGKKWWHETSGKIVAAVAGPLILGLIWFISGEVSAFGRATAAVYSLPPKVEDHDHRLHVLESRPIPAPMPSDLAQRLDSFLRSQEKRKP